MNSESTRRSLSTWFSPLTLCLLLGTGPANSAEGTAPEDNGPPRAVSFQVHDPEQARESRVALVIGNGDYRDAPLANPTNDARAMAAKLRELGFAVIEKQNASRELMAQASREFGNRLKLGGVGVFYYAGHGVQLNGQNYLLPIDADIQDDTELQTRAYDVSEILNKMDAAKNRLNIIILDACRNNPLPKATRAIDRGLAAMQQGTGTIISYATQPGATAADGPAGGNSLYTQQLLLALSQPGLRVEDVFKQVRMEVFRRSGGMQTPWENSSLIGEFYFNRGTGAAAEVADAGAAPQVQLASIPAQGLPTAGRNFQTAIMVPRKLLDTYQLASNLPMPAQRVLEQFTPDGHRFALVTQDRQLRVWDAVSANSLASQDGFDAPVASADGRYIVGVADDRSVNVVDITATPLVARNFKTTDAQQAVVSLKPQRLLVVTRAGLVNLYDLDSGRGVGTSPGKILGTPHITLAATGGRAVVWGNSASDLLLVDLESGKRIGKISQHGKGVLGVRFSRDGSLLLTSFDGGGAFIARSSDGSQVSKLALGTNNASLLKAEFLANSNELLGYAVDSDPKEGVVHSLAVWDTTKGKLVKTVAQGAAVTELRYSPESQQIYFAMSDNTISVFEINTKAKRKVLTDATLAGFSPDGTRVLAREGDGMRLYDARAFTPIARLPGQTGAFVQPDAAGVFATVSSSGDVSIWDFEHGDPIAQLKGHIDAVEEVVFAPGGKRVASFGKGRTAKLWGLPEVEGLEKLKRDEFETSNEYARRVAEWTSPYNALVSLVEYDADGETYAVRIGDVALTVPLPRADAKRFSGQREAVLTGRLRVYDANQLQLSDTKLSRLP